MNALEAWDMLVYNGKCLESDGDVFLYGGDGFVECLISDCGDANIAMDRTQFLIDYAQSRFVERAYD